MTQRPHPGPADELFTALQRGALARRGFTAAVLGAVAGLLSGLVVDWPFDLITAIAMAGALLVWDHRHGNLAGWWPTEHGPHRLAAVAARLERQGWAFLHVPEPAPPRCYLLIGPQGVFTLQHEQRPVSTNLHNGLVVIGRRPAVRHVQALQVTADAVRTAMAALTGNYVAVHAALVVESTTSEHPRVVADVTVLSVMDLHTWLCRRDAVLTEELILLLAEAAQRFFDDAPDEE